MRPYPTLYWLCAVTEPSLNSWAGRIATLGPVGHLSPAPGTWGSLAALPVAILLHSLGGFLALAIATIAVSALGIWVVAQSTAPGAHDPSEIVIDEMAGQWLALWPVSLGAWLADAPITALYPGIIVGFLLFRLFDIWKPGPVGWADRQATPLGVMLDDLIAGALAGLCVTAIAGAFHLGVGS